MTDYTNYCLPVNEFQTQITTDLLETLNKEIIDELFETINAIPFLRNLISVDRKRAKDLERDKYGRIIVDLSNPHILENMDYFRESALNFQKYGYYTKLKPSANPNSEFGKWLKREINRCWYGMIRKEDGEWITGNMYFYLNYFPIIQTKKTSKRTGIRIVDLPEMWEGVYLRFHYMDQARYGGLYNNFEGGQNGCEIARRGASKSYSLGAVLTKCFLLGVSKQESKKVRTLTAAYQKEFLIKDGTLNKFEDGINFCAENTQFPSQRIRSTLSNMEWVSGYIESNGQMEVPKGSENQALGISIKDDPDKIRGKRSAYVFFEEYGKFPTFLDTWQIGTPNVQEGEISFGMMYAIGTGGSEGSDFSGALEMINYPKGYNVYGIPNVYDKAVSNGKTRNTIFFFPGYLNQKGYYNKDGVSDVIGALVAELQIRYDLKYNSSDPMQLTRRKAEQAFTIQDAIMRRSGSLYPSDRLNDRILELDNNPSIHDSMFEGKISLKEGKADFEPDFDKKAIQEFPHKNNKIEGAVYIKNLPVKSSENSPIRGRYIAGIDTFDDDQSETLSLGSIYILDLFTDELVAEYTGRGMFADDFYEICRRLLLFYNAEANYENNKKGLYKYFSQYNCLYLLSDTLDFLKDKDNAKPALYGNKIKGTNASKPVQNYGRRAIRDYLLKTKSIVCEDEDNTVITKTVSMLDTICYRALLQELSYWNEDNNFDRHDALLMLMLLREDKLRLCGNYSMESRLENYSSSGLESDTFFDNNYKN